MTVAIQKGRFRNPTPPNGVPLSEGSQLASTPSVPAPDGGAEPTDHPRVLIYDPDCSQGQAIASRLRRSESHVTVIILTARGPWGDLERERADVCLINLANQRFDGLAVAAELAALFPWIEALFWFDEAGEPAAEAARSLGIRRLIPFACLAGWLDGALPQLSRMARARREQVSAEKALPPLPTGGRYDDALPLPEAERRFREVYLRRMLSVSESHAAAARKAGLPYTTFRSMLKKFGIP